MNRLIKYQALQGGVFTAQKNLVDFDIMDNAQHNLANSYVNLRGVVNTTDTVPGALDSPLANKGVYNYNFRWTAAPVGGNPAAASIYKFPNEALIKNTRFTCENQAAPLEDIRRSDVLRTQLAHFTQSDDDVYGQSYKDLCQVRTQGELTIGLGLDLVKEGSRLSKSNDVSVQIPLNKFLELGNMENFPTPKLGKCRLHLELNIDKLKLVQVLGNAMANDIGSAIPLTFNNVVNPAGGAAIDVTTLTGSFKFQDLKYSPFYVGQRLIFNSRLAGAANVARQRNITNIVYDNDTITLTLDSNLVTVPAGDTLSAIFCNGVNYASAEVEWNQCELVLEENAMMANMDELQYATYKNEEDNGNGLTTFSRQYNVEPECFNLFVCLPDNTAGDLWSVERTPGEYENYRLRNDNVDLTDRNVDIFKPLYTDRLAMTLLNGNLQLKNLNPSILSLTAAYINRNRNHPKTVFIGNPLPLTPTNKLLQITINGDSTKQGVNSIQLYKQVFKSIKL
jgi:hypothetical protein